MIYCIRTGSMQKNKTKKNVQQCDEKKEIGDQDNYENPFT